MDIQKIYRVRNKEFSSRESAQKYIEEQLEEDILRDEIKDLKFEIGRSLDQFIIPVFKHNRTSDSLKDKKINLVREELYKFMCLRRKILGVNEYN